MTDYRRATTLARSPAMRSTHLTASEISRGARECGRTTLPNRKVLGSTFAVGTAKELSRGGLTGQVAVSGLATQSTGDGETDLRSSSHGSQRGHLVARRAYRLSSLAWRTPAKFIIANVGDSLRVDCGLQTLFLHWQEVGLDVRIGQTAPTDDDMQRMIESSRRARRDWCVSTCRSLVCGLTQPRNPSDFLVLGRT
jgi:hypothetical protein